MISNTNKIYLVGAVVFMLTYAALHTGLWYVGWYAYSQNVFESDPFAGIIILVSILAGLLAGMVVYIVDEFNRYLERTEQGS